MSLLTLFNISFLSLLTAVKSFIVQVTQNVKKTPKKNGAWLRDTQSDQMIRKKNTPNFLKNSPKSCEVKKSQNIYIKPLLIP
jgi:hypothetical protein